MPLRSADKSFREDTPVGGGKVAGPAPLVFDPSDPNFKWEAGVKSKLDPEDNPFARLAPPPKGRYQLQCFATKDTFKKGTNRKDGSLYYSASMECKIVNNAQAELNGAYVYPKALYTSINRGQSISTMAKMIDLMGYGKTLEKRGYEVDEAEVVKIFHAVLKKEPLIFADLDWEGQFNAGTKEKPDYRVPFKSMDEFPTDEDGNPLHSVHVSDGSGGTAEVNARLKVVEWIGKANVQEGQGAIKVVEAPAVEVKAETKPNGKAKEKVKVKEPEPEVEEIASSPVVSDDELVLED